VIATPDIPGHTITGVLGNGGFATVYRGLQLAVGREVAVKVDNRVLISERDQRRFVREVTAAGRLSGHPHVIDVYDAGTLDDGRPYMVMEFCPGGSLDDAIRRDGPMTPAQVRDIGIRIADALAAAHEAGILHRDIKPANILVNRYGMVGLSDFGLASILAGEGEQSVTREALTPAFASPESFRADEPTVTADLYSLAATLYALLAGRPPRFPADGGSPSFATMVGLHDKPVEDVPGTPPELMAALRKSLAADPAVRPQSAAALRDTLLAFAAPGSGPLAQATTSTTPRAQPDPPRTLTQDALPTAHARHARRSSGTQEEPPPAMVPPATGRQRAGRSRIRRSALVGGTLAAVALTSAISLAFSLSSNPSTAASSRSTGRPTPQPGPQAKFLEERLKGKTFKECDVPTHPVAGAEATINCQTNQPGITITASSFKVTGPAIPFNPSLIAGESSGLNAFLNLTILSSLPLLSTGQAALNAIPCSPQVGATCPYVGYSGFWGSPQLTIGRLYCYKESGSYYIVWTFDNDSYEASYYEDFVVVASGGDPASLLNWWRQAA